MKVFEKKQLKDLHQPVDNKNGQVTIIGGSELFHGAPILSLIVASRIVDMVFFASPEKSVGAIAENLKSKLMSFIWVPWEEVDHYANKSDAILIGPGLMRYRSEKTRYEKGIESDEAYQLSRKITKKFLTKFPQHKWVIDAGSLQVMDADWIPKNAVLTPNKKEFKMLFGDMSIREAAKKHQCTIIDKGVETRVCSPTDCVLIKGGNAGLAKGGTGDVLAGLTTALMAKNDPFLAASSAEYLVKATADEFVKKVGTRFNADDLANKIPETLHNLLK